MGCLKAILIGIIGAFIIGLSILFSAWFTGIHIHNELCNHLVVADVNPGDYGVSVVNTFNISIGELLGLYHTNDVNYTNCMEFSDFSVNENTKNSLNVNLGSFGIVNLYNSQKVNVFHNSKVIIFPFSGDGVNDFVNYGYYYNYSGFTINFQNTHC